MKTILFICSIIGVAVLARWLFMNAAPSNTIAVNKNSSSDILYGFGAVRNPGGGYNPQIIGGAPQ